MTRLEATKIYLQAFWHAFRSAKRDHGYSGSHRRYYAKYWARHAVYTERYQRG